jgi:hypothetical protein
VEEVDIDPLLHRPFTPELVGNKQQFLITSTTGPFGMWRKLDELGVEVAKDDVIPILHACWSFMERLGKRIEDSEIIALARSVVEARSQSKNGDRR